MRLIIRLDPTRLRQWHLRLVARLAQRPDTQVVVEWGAPTPALPSGLKPLLAMERLIHWLPAGGVAAPVCSADFAAYVRASGDPADLTLDLCEGEPQSAARHWAITFDGCRGEAAALGALAQGRTPVVAVVDTTSGREIISGHPGAETGRILLLAFEDVLARTATLVMAALDGAPARHVGTRPAASKLDQRMVARFAVKSVISTIIGSAYRLLYNAPHWRVGWRFVEDGADVIDTRTHPTGGWRELPVDRRRFYADPFPVVKDGRTFVFVEEFEHRLGRGVISVVEFDERGPIGVPRPVLDLPHHLSYPFVIEHRGEMWMVPESCAADTIDLYRSTAFPDGWVKQTTLVSGQTASDATLLEHGGKWWMLATVRDHGGPFSDALHAWSAPDITGPWQPHRHNPLMVDIASARPAGRVVRRNGKLIRPVQDCRDGYGAALGIAEILRLDDDGFAQRVETVLRPGPLWPGRRLHTLNRAGRLECIDGSAWALRF